MNRLLLLLLLLCSLILIRAVQSEEVRRRRSRFVMHPAMPGSKSVSLDTPPNPATTCTFTYAGGESFSAEEWEMLVQGDAATGELLCHVRRLPDEHDDWDEWDEEDRWLRPSQYVFRNFELGFGEGAKPLIEAVVHDSNGMQVPEEAFPPEGARIKNPDSFQGSLQSLKIKTLLYE